MSFEATKGTHSCAPTTFNQTTSQQPSEKKAEESSFKKVKQPLDDLELDGLKREFQKKEVTNSSGKLLDNYVLPAMDPVSAEKIKLLRSKLIESLPFIVKDKTEKKTDSYKLPQTLLQFLRTINLPSRLAGSYLLSLLDPDWLINSGSKLIDQAALMKWISKKDLLDFSDSKEDLDVHCHIKSTEIPSAQCAENLIIEYAKKIKNTKRSEKELCNLIRRSDGPFKKFHPLFHLYQNNIVNDAYLISLSNELGLEVDVVMARILNSFSLVSIQDMWFDIDKLIQDPNSSDLPPIDGSDGKGWQAIIDILCRIIRFKSMTYYALMKGLNLMTTKKFRSPDAIPTEIFDHLRLYCENLGGVPAGVKRLLEKSFAKPYFSTFEAKIALAFNMTSTLYHHNFSTKDLGTIWAQLRKKWKEVPSSTMGILLESTQHIPFPSLSSFLMLQHILPLGQETLDRKVKLTEHDAQTHLMVSVDKTNLMMPFKPVEALKTLHKWAVNLNSEKNTKEIDALQKMSKAFRFPFSYQLTDKAPLKKYFEHLNLNMDDLNEISMNLLKIPLPEIKELGFKFLFISYSFNPTHDGLRALLVHLPIAWKNGSADGLAQLLTFLGSEVKKSEALSPLCKEHLVAAIHRDHPSSLFSWIKTLAKSKDRLLFNQAWKYVKTELSSEGAPQRKELLFFLFNEHVGENSSLALEMLEIAFAEQLLIDKESEIVDSINVILDKYSKEDSKEKERDELYRSMKLIGQLNKTHVYCRENFPATIKSMVTKALENKNEHFASKLLIHSTQEKAIELNETNKILWIECCEKLYQNSVTKNKEECLSFWKKGIELGAWTPSLFKDHQPFLIAFVKHLYGSKTVACDHLGHEVLNILTQTEPTGKLATRTQELVQQSKDKKAAEKKFSSDLPGKVEELIANPSKDKKEIKELLEKIIEEDTSFDTPEERFLLIKRLLSIPKLPTFFNESKDELEQLLLKALDIALKYQESLPTTHLVFLIEWTLNHSFPMTESKENKLSTRFVNFLASFLAQHDKLENTHLLRDGVHRHSKTFYESLKSNANSQGTIDLTFGLINYHLLPSLPLNFYTQDICPTICETLRKCKNEINTDQQLAMCKKILQKMPSDTLDNCEHENIKTFESLVEALLDLKLYPEAIQWISRIADSQAFTSSEVHIQWMLNLTIGLMSAEKPNTEVAASILALTEKHLEKFHEKMLNTLLEQTDDFVGLAPKIFTTVAIKELNSKKRAEASLRFQQKISLLTRHLLNFTGNKDALRAVTMMEESKTSSYLSLEKLLSLADSSNDNNLKKRAWKVYHKHQDSLEFPSDWIENKQTHSKWLECWKTAVKVLKTVCIKTKDEDLIGQLEAQLENMLDPKSQLTKVMEVLDPQEIAFTITFLMKSFMDVLFQPKGHIKGLNKLIQLDALLTEQPVKGNLEESVELSEKLIDRIAKSADVSLFSEALGFIEQAFLRLPPKYLPRYVGMFVGLIRQSAPIEYNSNKEFYHGIDALIDLLVTKQMPDEILKTIQGVYENHPHLNQLPFTRKLINQLKDTQIKLELKQKHELIEKSMTPLDKSARHLNKMFQISILLFSVSLVLVQLNKFYKDGSVSWTQFVATGGFIVFCFTLAKSLSNMETWDKLRNDQIKNSSLLMKLKNPNGRKVYT